MRKLLMMCLLFHPAFSSAEPIPIRFTELPPGSAAYFRNNQEGLYAEVYLGLRDGHHVLERRRGSPYGEVMLERHFNADGLEIRRIYADGKETEFSPYNCERMVGTCTHMVITSRGTRDVHSVIEKFGDTYVMEMRYSGLSQPRRRKAIAGDYGFFAFVRENDTQTALESVE